MWEAVQKFIDRFESRLSLATWIGASGALGLVSGYLGSTVQWLNQFGAFGWWMAGLTGFALSAFGFGAVGWARQRWIMAAAASRLHKEPDAVNPLDKEFHKKRIRLYDIAHPITRSVGNKRFLDCQIIGPGLIMIQNENVISFCTLTNCDAVLIQPGRKMYNGIALSKCEFLRCEFINFVIVGPDSVIRDVGIQPLN